MIQEAYRWYEKQRIALGELFLTALDTAYYFRIIGGRSGHISCFSYFRRGSQKMEILTNPCSNNYLNLSVKTK